MYFTKEELDTLIRAVNVYRMEGCLISDKINLQIVYNKLVKEKCKRDKHCHYILNADEEIKKLRGIKNND